MTRPIKPLPYRFYYLPVLSLTIVGIIDSAYLSYSHYRNYTDLTYASFCAISKAINCDTVSQSSWSVLLGVPVALWGLFGYMLLLILLLTLRKPRSELLSLWSAIVFLGFVYSVAAFYFGYISATKVNAYCILCIVSYGVSFSLFYFSWLIHRRFNHSSVWGELISSAHYIKRSKRLYISLIVFIIMSIFTGVYIPHYWELKPAPMGDNVSKGITNEGYSWIGAEQPVVTITEFSDYMCFQCSKMHFFVRQLVEKFPDKLRLVHRHFPMDHLYNPLVDEPFHSGSGKMAMIALYAQSKGKFWEASDILFDVARQKMNFNTRLIADTLEVSKYEMVLALEDKYYRIKLKHDIAVGIDHGIVGTPGFIIDDQVYNGYIPKKILSELVDKLSQ